MPKIRPEDRKIPNARIAAERYETEIEGDGSDGPDGKVLVSAGAVQFAARDREEVNIGVERCNRR